VRERERAYSRTCLGMFYGRHMDIRTGRINTVSIKGEIIVFSLGLFALFFYFFLHSDDDRGVLSLWASFHISFDSPPFFYSIIPSLDQVLRFALSSVAYLSRLRIFPLSPSFMTFRLSRFVFRLLIPRLIPRYDFFTFSLSVFLLLP
jgi:hypothetical protein